ncbi:unnamed protein product [Adineta ricciae]|uniref:LRRCT domain-containing protein n=1 Tax=Adineta ricciae TaxID=249248 RepID=A0A813UIJ8_ADIRI|nr:unnamed protein product [Adineta ricciae]
MYCFFLILASLLFTNTYSFILTDLCPNVSCNCTLADYQDLTILCDPTVNLTELPTLNNSTLQHNVTQLRLASSTNGIRGHLIEFPSNISVSYPKIAILDLSFNMIRGLLNTSKLAGLGSNLLIIDLSDNFITDITMNFFQANGMLQSINLSKNNLTRMPSINSATFVAFPSELINMNFSSNQITNLDLWPLFVKTGKTMVIDLSHNLIANYTNQIPISLQQFTETPDPRFLYVNDNQLERLSDVLLEQYGACSTSTNSNSVAFFVVGISNMLLTNNPLICDCESYYLVSYIQDNINDFPQMLNRSALITQAKCTSPSSMNGQIYLFSNITETNFCANYRLPNLTDIFCSVYPNDTLHTLAPPSYWSSTSTAVTLQTTVANGTMTISTSGSGGSINGTNDTSKSSSPSWYIILGIVLGLLLIIILIVLGIILCKDRLLPAKCRSLLRNEFPNTNNSYATIIHERQMSSHALPSNINHGNNHTMRANHTLSNSFPPWLDQNYPEQETQTSVQILRSKSSTGTKRPSQRTILPTSSSKVQVSSTQSTSIPTGTKNIVKGIPLAAIQSRSNPDTFELNMSSVPVTPSKRATFLPQVKSGIYTDSKTHNLLNTSAGALATNERQRRRSTMWLRKQYQNQTTTSYTRAQSMTARKSSFNEENSSDEEEISIPTIESSTDKSLKSMHALPIINISGLPSWVDDDIDQQK